MDSKIDAIYGRQSIDKKDSISVEERLEAVDKREEPFHWGINSVLSAKEGRQQEALPDHDGKNITVGLMFLMPDRTIASVVVVLDMLKKKLRGKNFRRISQTIAVGNGSEFQD